eukprot:5245790-Pyramimonas_sp.AAC.1
MKTNNACIRHRIQDGLKEQFQDSLDEKIKNTENCCAGLLQTLAVVWEDEDAIAKWFDLTCDRAGIEVAS